MGHFVKGRNKLLGDDATQLLWSLYTRSLFRFFDGNNSKTNSEEFRVGPPPFRVSAHAWQGVRGKMFCFEGQSPPQIKLNCGKSQVQPTCQGRPSQPCGRFRFEDVPSVRQSPPSLIAAESN